MAVEEKERRMKRKAIYVLVCAGAGSLGLAMVPRLALATPAASKATGGCPWVSSTAPIQSRVEQLLGRMSVSQKIQELHGTPDSAYAGVIPAIPSLCIPALTLQDGPAGAGDGFVGVTQLPAPVALAATWDPELARKYGAVVGAEQWGKGVTIDLGPTVNIVRDPRWGRAFETYSEDPYLNGQIGAGYVNGLQGEGVMAQVKHWAVYNQDTYRNTPRDSVVVKKRVLQELYLPQFSAIIRTSHPASLMCSYVTVNGADACQNPYLLTHVLRDEFHFKGFVTSDWGGTHSTIGPAKAGMNISMPTGKYYGAPLKKAVASGQVSTTTVDGLVRPVLAEMFRMHLFTHYPTGRRSSVVTNPAHAATALNVAERGAVLLKNSGNILPLSAGKVHSIAVIGVDAGASAMTAGGGSAHVNADSIVTPLRGIASRAGHEVTVRYAQGNMPASGLPPMISSTYMTPMSGHGHGLTEQLYANASLSGPPVSSHDVSRSKFLRMLWTGAPSLEPKLKAGQWSGKVTGTLTPPATGTYAFSITAGAGETQLYVNHKLVIARQPFSHTGSGVVTLKAGRPASIQLDYFSSRHAFSGAVRLGWRMPIPLKGQSREKALIEQAAHLAASSDVAVVFASKFESEGYDLPYIGLPGDQNRLISAVAAANPNTVVVLNTGSAVTMPWLGSVKGVIEDWYPGQEDGTAIAALLFGDVNPSGKLPVTFPKHLADVPAYAPARWPGVDGRVHFAAGLDIGYRWYEARDIKPQFPFGYGLSYTTFAFSHLDVTPRKMTPSGGDVQVSVDIANTGKRSGADVVQLYVADPTSADEPPRWLKGFQKVELKPGQTRRIHFQLPTRAFATWNEKAHKWRVIGGGYRIMVGDSSSNLPERGTVQISGGNSAD